MNSTSLCFLLILLWSKGDNRGSFGFSWKYGSKATFRVEHCSVWNKSNIIDVSLSSLLYYVSSSSSCLFAYYVAWFTLQHFIPMALIYALLKMTMMFCFIENELFILQQCLLCLTVFVMSRHCFHLFEILKLQSICICEYFGALSIAMISEMNNCHNNIFLILTCSIFNVCSVWMMDTCPCYMGLTTSGLILISGF